MKERFGALGPPGNHALDACGAVRGGVTKGLQLDSLGTKKVCVWGWGKNAICVFCVNWTRDWKEFS